MKGAQHGFKGQYILVPTDLKKTEIILPRSYDEEYLISLALKCRLTGVWLTINQFALL